MKQFYSVAELIALELSSLPSTAPGIRFKVKQEQWAFQEVDRKGGKRRE